MAEMIKSSENRYESTQIDFLLMEIFRNKTEKFELENNLSFINDHNSDEYRMILDSLDNKKIQISNLENKYSDLISNHDKKFKDFQFTDGPKKP